MRSRQITQWMCALSMACAALVSVPSHAQGSSQGLNPRPDQYGVLRLSTLGAGVDYSQRFSSDMYWRVNLNGLSLSRDFTQAGINYNADVKLQSAGLLVDWHPFATGFRVSGGLYYNGNKATLKANPNSAGGGYLLNGTTYSSAEINSLNGALDFRNAAPYLGLGYYKAIGALSLVGDAGVMLAGTPRVNLDVNCATGLAGARCAQARSDAAVEADRVRDGLDSLRYYPVLSIGLGYKF